MNRSKRLARRRAFTLIEVVIAIAVLALLASVSLVAVTSALKHMKKVRRAADLDQVVKALEIYKQRYGEYPPSWSEEFDESDDSEETDALADESFKMVRRHVLKRWPKEASRFGNLRSWEDVKDNAEEFRINGTSPFDAKTALEYWLCASEEDHGNAPILDDSFVKEHSGQFAYFRAWPAKGQDGPNRYEGYGISPRLDPARYAGEEYLLFAAGEDGELGTDDDLANFTHGETIGEFIADEEQPE